MSDYHEIAYIENLDGESCGALVRLVAKLDPTEGTPEDVNTPRWSSEERSLILGCQEASAYEGAEDDEDDDESDEDTDDEVEEEDPTSDNSLSPYDTVVILTDEQAAALAQGDRN